MYPSRAKTDIKRHPDKYFLNPQGHVRDRILIHPSLEIPKEGLFLSLNGYSFLAKPGIEIDIPRPVRQMIDTRIKTETIQGEDGKEYHRDIPRITYTLIKEGVNVPDPEDISTDNADNIPSAEVINAVSKKEDPDWDEAGE